MSRTPAEISDRVFEDARAHFSEPQLVELVATVAMENYRARFNRAFGIESQGLCQVRGIELPLALELAGAADPNGEAGQPQPR